MANVRKVTNEILEMIDNGAIDPIQVVQMCLSYMSEADVADMAQANDLSFDDDDDDEEEEEEDGDED